MPERVLTQRELNRTACALNVKTPQSTATFLVDSVVAGTWRYEKDRIELSPFGRLDRSAKRALDGEAERLAALHRDD